MKVSRHIVLCLLTLASLCLPKAWAQEVRLEIGGSVFGGARSADVNATHVTINAGKVHDVYGGNDIGGTVHDAATIEIFSSIAGSVYGAGNGSYVYTDQEANKDEDLYYDPGTDSAEALLSARPQQAKTSIKLRGTETNPTYIRDGVYMGGNSATLSPTDIQTTTSANLHIGSHVVAGALYMGCNGGNMVTEETLGGEETLGSYADNNRSSLDLTKSETMEKYMEGVLMTIRPTVTFEDDYEDYTAKFGSVFGGGNVGSVAVSGTHTMDWVNHLLIFDKLVAGCNNANVPSSSNNALYAGGLLDDTNPTTKVRLNLDGVKLEPRVLAYDEATNSFNLDEWKKAGELLSGANVYGGCYKSGHIAGGVQISLTKDAISEEVFPGSGVSYNALRDALFSSTLSIYGGGYGEASEVRGNVAVNITGDGRILKAYGGGEMGVVKGNTAVSLNANLPAGETLNAAKLYAGGYQGLVTGNTTLNLDQGRVYSAFGGACNANIEGAASTYIGTNTRPIVLGNVYGGNDFGGQISGSLSHETRNTTAQYQSVRSNTYVEYNSGSITGNIFGASCGAYDYSLYTGRDTTTPTLLTLPTFTGSEYAANAFVNIRSQSTDAADHATNIFGGGQGMAGKTGCADLAGSYVLLQSLASALYPVADEVYGAGDYSTTTTSLVDACTGNTNRIFGGAHGASFTTLDGTGISYMCDASTVNVYSGINTPALDVFGAGAYAGSKQSLVKLHGGTLHNVYGATFDEGVTYGAQVLVPATSTAKVNAIFGGALGADSQYPCDAYVTLVDFRAPSARVEQGIYGGNHNARFTRDAYVYLNVPLLKNQTSGSDEELSPVYGAGYGQLTAAGRTHVYLAPNARVAEVYGGGQDGRVLEKGSLAKCLDEEDVLKSASAYWSHTEPAGFDDAFATTVYGALNTQIADPELTFANDYETSDEPSTHVVINAGASVAENAYGGGLGTSATVAGTTRVDLLGGTVGGNLFGGGYGGDVCDVYGLKSFTASTTVNFPGGSARGVYGGGLNGHVGTDAGIASIKGNTHVTLGGEGIASPTFLNGDPTVERSIFGGGQRGAVFGTTNLTIYGGHVGYVYEDGDYKENNDLRAPNDGLLAENGNAFGAGYGEGATVDITNVTLWGGTIRNSLYGGGEIAAVGRGKISESGDKNSQRVVEALEAPGETHITMYGGQVKRDIFGGGRGYSYDLTGNEVIGERLYTDGYVFGSTEVLIRGGVVGTEDGAEKGYGNVFGGGNIGYVYNVTGSKHSDGYYYDAADTKLTEDCRVVVSPYCRVTSDEDVTIGDEDFKKGEYVPTEYLNKLQNKNSDTRWKSLDDTGITIHNAVFAGGNVSMGSDKVYANATTVFGNVSATIFDVYHRDLISIGTEHIGGLYGDGNLTFVDGYRELNITNYGTDYYGMEDRIDLDVYNTLSDRERAYFSLEYECQQKCTIGDKSYDVGDRVEEDKYDDFPDEFKTETYWKKSGFCSIYAGRLMNTIQRADMVGIFGSRLVLQGARDRVTDVVDFTDYTINRVGEVSLNQRKSDAGDTKEEDMSHGNYFGMYNVVNYLGNLTSDVAFSDVRTTTNETYEADGKTTYYEWKLANATNRKRNNGSCANKVALASGVYLELTTEESTKDNKVWGYITGIVELDLINVQQGYGGGYVYARNEHGDPTYYPKRPKVILSEYNKEAVTYKKYDYDETEEKLKAIETSGNFIHATKRIVDDCYPNNGVYLDGYVDSPAHYWYIKGDIYVYDQTISAYTGSATAYPQTISIPLSITAASHGQITLSNVQTNRYAYYDSKGEPIGSGGAIFGGKTYFQGDVISYWDFQQLSEAEQACFLKDVYISVTPCEADGTSYPAGTVQTPEQYAAFKASHAKVTDTTKDEKVDVDEVFRRANNVEHEKGYLLTFDMNNPSQWDNWYSITNTQDVSASKPEHLNTEQYKNAGDKGDYTEGPTYRPQSSGVYGQKFYDVNDIITKDIVDNYGLIPTEAKPTVGQATVEPAYVAVKEVTYTYAGTSSHVYPGVPIPESEYTALDATAQEAFKPAWVCTSTLDLGESNFLFYNDLVDAAEITRMKTLYKENFEVSDDVASDAVDNSLSPAYICSQKGNYGGRYYLETTNYSAIESWCVLSDEDREQFNFNKDAFNLLLDPTYSGTVTQYGEPYCVTQEMDYEATYVGEVPLVYKDADGNDVTIALKQKLTRQQFDEIPNEEYNYTAITVPKGTTEPATYYVVLTAFVRGDTPYAKGEVMTESTYNALSDDQKAKAAKVELANPEPTDQVFYYCYREYKIGEKGEYSDAFKDINDNTYTQGSTIPVGTVITSGVYETAVPNYQKYFLIQGVAPEETATLYVPRESDINDLSRDRIITVVYQYTYDESDETGLHIEPINEIHVVNIHLSFKSGVPTIGQLQPPSTVLPGSTVGLKQPETTRGAYEILGGGWEVFTNRSDAESHKNGIPYVNNATPMYWYEDGYYVAYYTKTYLGKTYSNAVQFSIANYHDLDAVMADKDYHLHVDHPNVHHESKIYIDNRACVSDPTKSELDLLRDFFDLTRAEAPANGHAVLNTHVRDCENLEFFLRSDVEPKAYTKNWNPLGDNEGCFEGVVHGDGYTVSELDNSLFGNLCGDVYNLGVTGSFTGAGVADTGSGYVENCWVKTTGEADGNVFAVFGNPTRGSGTQVVNCYYPDTNAYSEANCERGRAKKMPLAAFENGEVAYNLNGFYLKKRYHSHEGDSETLEGNPSYVEDRYEYIDFIYAGGTIPTTADERLDAEDGNYYPLPDDYFFFGQTLTYGYDTTRPHGHTPTHIAKSAAGHVITSSALSNRVFRAPAYYRSKVQSVVHFNPNAYLTDKSFDGSYDVYPNMTAVDFTGYADEDYTKAWDESGRFYRPLLDNDGLTAVHKYGITPNLLVYIPKEDVDAKTHTVLNDYFASEPAYEETRGDYRTVARTSSASVLGHAVQQTASGDYVATNDHLLVDKRDFNAPIAYKFGSGKRMWYQREPDNFVDASKGWESISLPFEAELVTTQDKGELTHFYGTSKRGHEYWLREFTNISPPDAEGVATALFTAPATVSGNEKEDANSFLWDYYYSYNDYHDANGDDYQESDTQGDYYRNARTYAGYAYLQPAVPYLVGFPGARYYEFDLSGNFEATHTANTPDPAPEKLNKQTLTFASEEGASIAVSDDELTAGKQTYKGYTFWPNYLEGALPDGAFTMQTDGSAYSKIEASTLTEVRQAVPFRTYFTPAGGDGVKPTRQIVFSDDASSLYSDEDGSGSDAAGGLLIRTARGTITVTSSLPAAKRVRIVSVQGVAVADFRLQPGETVTTHVSLPGVYLVNKTKIVVK